MSVESEILTQALALPEADRAELISRLLISLEPGDPDGDHEARWASEIDRRRGAFERGETTATPWREAMSRIEKDLHVGADE